MKAPGKKVIKSRKKTGGTEMAEPYSSTLRGQNAPKQLQDSKRLPARTNAQPGQDPSDKGDEPFEKATSVEFKPDISCAEAFRIITDNCIRQIVANEPGMCAGHAEALHQLRIGLRRLRVAIKAFKRVTADPQQEAISTELRWAMKQVGLARDLDVFGAEVFERLDQIGRRDRDLAAAHSSYDEMRRQAHESARISIRSDRFRDLLINLTEWIKVGAWTTNAALREMRERKVVDLAVEILGEWRKGLRKRCRKLGTLTPKQRHRLRMRAEDSRYVTEFFASLFRAHEKRRIASLAALEKLQDTLGALNDLNARKGIMPKEINQSAHARSIITAQEHKAGELLDEAKAACAKFREVKAFWK
jgi:triphosphatase